ncbi:MAG: glycoside hydrolase family 26 protein [Nocardioides sp.]
MPSPLRLVRPLLGTTLAVAALALSSVLAATAPADARTPRTLSAPPPPRIVGVAVPGAPTDLGTLSTLTSELGQAPAQVTWYAAWATVADFPSADAARVAATGAVPEVTWEPWDPAAGVDQPAYRLSRITTGAFDTYLNRWAREIRGYGKPVVLRFAHEMNGNWYPWAEGVNGNQPGDFAAAWRHVVGVFTRNKVTNVTWTWAPNIPYTGSTPLTALYPGDAYVGRVGLDGYNWSTVQPWSTWQSFADVFSPGLAQLAALTTKPVYIAETACPEVGGDKAAWIRDMWSTLAVHPEVRGITWFDYDKETDWRIDSSPASLDAFATGMRSFS